MGEPLKKRMLGGIRHLWVRSELLEAEKFISQVLDQLESDRRSVEMSLIAEFIEIGLKR